MSLGSPHHEPNPMLPHLPHPHPLTTPLTSVPLPQGIDAVKRVRSDHAEQETDWEHAVNIWCLLQPVVRMMVAWCLSDVRGVAAVGSVRALKASFDL